MKLNKIISFTLVLLLTCFGFSLKTNNLSAASTEKSLGIFRDLTQEEVKDYYKDLETGLKGDALLKELQDILKKDQVKLNYTSGNKSSKTWDGYYLLERDWEKSPLTDEEISSQTYKRSNIWLNPLYSTNSLLISDGINSGNFSYYDENGKLVSVAYKNGRSQLDREHVFPKSFGFNGDVVSYKDLTAGCDMQNLHAGEHAGNSAGHNNLPFGNVVLHNSDTAIVSGITGEIVGYRGDNADGIECFEPLDVDKGDIARCLFYMCARYNYYEKLNAKDETPALTLKNMVSPVDTLSPIDTKDNPSGYGQLDDLLEWHELDPVDTFEIHRNNLCYNAIQFNRNPFIDYPAWVDVCFTDSTTGIDLSSPTGVPAKSGLIVNSGVTSITKNSKLDLSNFEFKATDNGETNTVSLNELTYKVTLNDKEVAVDDLSNYVFNQLGKYEITFSYVLPSTSETVNCVYSFDVVSKYSLKIVTDVVKTEFEVTDTINLLPENIKVYEGNTEVATASDVKIKIYDGDELVSEDFDFKFNKLGDYNIKLFVTYDGDELETNIIVSCVPSFKMFTVMPYLLYLIIFIIALIIFIILLVNGVIKKAKSHARKVKKFIPYKNRRR